MGFDVDMKPLKDTEAALERFKLSAVSLGAATVAAAASLFGISKVAADYGEESLKAAKKLGINADEFQRLATAAHMADVEQEGLLTSLRFLNKAMAEAQAGNKDTANSLASVGIRGVMPVNEAFRAMLVNFKKLPNQAVKTKVAMELLGRAGVDMVPFLSAGNQALEDGIAIAEKYRLVTTAAQNEAANAFNDALKEAMLAVKGLTVAIGNDLIPVVMPIIREFADFVAENFDAVKGTLMGFAKAAMVFLKIVVAAFKAVWYPVKALITVLGGFEKVATILSGAFGIFLTGALATSVYALTSAFIALAAATLPVWGPMAAAAAGVGAALALIGLMIEDLIVSLQGGDGYFADLFNWIKTIPDKILSMFDGLANGAKRFADAIWQFLTPPINWLSDKIKSISDVFGGVANKVSDVLKSASDKVVNFFKGTPEVSATQQLMAPSATAAPAASGAQVQQNISNTFQITPPASLSSERAAEAVQSGVETSLDRSLRQADRSFQGGAQ